MDGKCQDFITIHLFSLKSVCCKSCPITPTPALIQFHIAYLIYLNILIEWKVL